MGLFDGGLPGSSGCGCGGLVLNGEYDAYYPDAEGAVAEADAIDPDTTPPADAMADIGTEDASPEDVSTEDAPTEESSEDGSTYLCEIGSERSSYSGPSRTDGAGICRSKIEECVDSGDGPVWVTTQDEILPSEDLCGDGLDNDCDGRIDGFRKIFTLSENSEIGASVEQTEDGGYIMAVDSFFDMSIPRYHPHLVKTDNLGGVLWDRVYDAPDTTGIETFWVLRETLEGGFFILGLSRNYSYLYNQLIKTDGDGDPEFTRILRPTVNSMEQTHDGGYIYADWYDLVRTDSMGYEMWRTGYLADRPDLTFFSVKPTEDGGFIGGGRISDSTDWNSIIIKTDEDGNERWNRVYDVCADDGMWFGLAENFRLAQQTQDGGYVFVVTCSDDTWPLSTSWLVRTDENGDEIWRRSYESYGGGIEEPDHTFIETTDGGFFFAKGVGSRAYELIKTDSMGEEVWSESYIYEPMFLSVSETIDGGFIAAGGKIEFDAQWHPILEKVCPM